MTPRERQVEIENAMLSPFAQKSAESRGRERPLSPCAIRSEFQRDRDRIIHCKSFRRLKHKTQVFLLPDGDHYRTRLTHTLEVSQIARTIARALRLNEDLVEAIALGHDLGHTPFGHVGENVLNSLLPKGFQHNEQSLRIVEVLENGEGLNLCWEVRDGILHHKRNGKPATLEGKVVSFADRIAYLNHDIDDAVRAGVLRESDLPKRCTDCLGKSHGERINSMILDIYETSADKPFVAMSEETEAAMNELRDFMFARVYTDPVAKREESKAMRMLEMLFTTLVARPELLPEEFARRMPEDGVAVSAADHIACMTDRYAIASFEALYLPQGWSV